MSSMRFVARTTIWERQPTLRSVHLGVEEPQPQRLMALLRLLAQRVLLEQEGRIDPQRLLVRVRETIKRERLGLR